MDSKIEEIDIQINPDLKPKGKIEKARLSEILSKFCSKIFCCSSDLSTKIIKENASNPVLRGYYKAYVNHCPICITPDILWMLVVHGFSRHVVNNSEQLRNKFVNFEGKKKLIVDISHFETLEEIKKNEWEKSFEQYVEKIRENVGGMIISILTPCFTTSTTIIQNATQVAIMSTFKNYFEYGGIFGGCGFPYIKLQGTIMDYMQLKMKVQGLLGYGLDDWLKVLIPIIDKILETKQGKIDKKFWENFLKNDYVTGPYGPSGSEIKVEKLSGWLLNFYPFYKKNERRYNFDEPIREREIENFAEEVIDAPLIMRHRRTGEEFELICNTGFLGAIQDKNNIVKPEIGWYICRE